MKKGFLALIAILIIVYFNNASWLRPIPDSQLRLLAHRGVHQHYSKDQLSRQDCTATRIDPPVHAYLENTMESIREAFSLGAHTVEIDIHPTTDNRFVVFHNWTLDCRTQAKGVTRKHTLDYLKSLDIGYGYTHDGGKTFPFRGKGIGKMPSLSEVLDTFSEQRFLINIKSKDPNEVTLINQYLKTRSNDNLSRLSFYGNRTDITPLLATNPEIKGFNKASIKKCVKAVSYTHLTLPTTPYV